MKILSSLLFLLVPFITHAQDTVKLASFPYDPSHTNIVYEKVTNSSLSKEQLYKDAQTWIAKTFGDYKSVIQFEDKDNGRLICKGVIPISNTLNQHLTFTMVIDVKQQKFRAQISDIHTHMDKGTGGEYNYTLEDDITRNIKRTDSYKYAGYDILNSYDNKVNLLLDNFVNSMNIKDDF